MKIIKVKLYSFDELSEESKQKAIENFLAKEREYFWMNKNLESLKNGLEFFGFKLKNYNIKYHSVSASSLKITSEHGKDEIQNLSGVRLWKYLQTNYSKYWCKYDKKFKPLLDGDCPFTGYCADENFLDKIREFILKPTNITFIELMGNCSFDVLKCIESDYNYQNSKEFAAEELSQKETNYLETGIEYKY